MLGVKNGGAVLDSNGRNALIAEPLVGLPASTGGLTKLGTSYPGSGRGAQTIECPSGIWGQGDAPETAGDDGGNCGRIPRRPRPKDGRPKQRAAVDVGPGEVGE